MSLTRDKFVRGPGDAGHINDALLASTVSDPFKRSCGALRPRLVAIPKR